MMKAEGSDAFAVAASLALSSGLFHKSLLSSLPPSFHFVGAFTVIHSNNYSRRGGHAP